MYVGITCILAHVMERGYDLYPLATTPIFSPENFFENAENHFKPEEHHFDDDAGNPRERHVPVLI